MRVYIAARAKTQEQAVAGIVKKLKGMGHIITYDWASENNRALKPYRLPEHRQHNSQAVTKMLNAAANADVFILLDEVGLRGAYIELGAFLHAALKDMRNRKVYIVGADSREREHIFESPEFVEFVNDIEAVYIGLKQI